MAKQMRKGEKGSDPNNDPNGRDLLRRLRRRLLLVRQKTLHHLSLQSLIARHSGQRLTANAIKALTNEQLATYLDAPILLGGQITHQARCWLDEAISRIERELQQRIQPRKDYQLLQSIPAVARPPEVSRVGVLLKGSDPNGTYLRQNHRHPGAGRDPVAPSVASFLGFRPAPE